MHFSGKALLFAVVCATSSACVTQRQYDDAVEFGRNQQTLLHEREQQIAQLEAERDRLRREMAANGVSALSEAGYGGDLESRLSELQSKIDALGRPMGDIERIEVDGGYILLVQDRILFGSGSSDLSDEGRKTIQKIADRTDVSKFAGTRTATESRSRRRWSASRTGISSSPRPARSRSPRR